MQPGVHPFRLIVAVATSCEFGGIVMGFFFEFIGDSSALTLLW